MKSEVRGATSTHSMAGVHTGSHNMCSTEHPGVVHSAAVQKDEAFLSWDLK